MASEGSHSRKEDNSMLENPQPLHKKRKVGKSNEAAEERTNQSCQQPQRRMKNFLHGVSYQQKLITLLLCHAAKRMKEDTDFRFRISTEDEEAGKFDDVVFQSWQGDKCRSLFIQAKHKQSEDTTITWNDMISPANDAPFAIGKYFKSYLDQNWDTWEEPPMLVICTNIDLADDVKCLFVKYSFEDVVISPFFDSLSGAALTLVGKQDSEKHDALMEHLNDSDFVNLARLLAKHIFNKEKIGCNQPLFNKYHLAIESHIAIDEKMEGKQCRKVSEDFLDPSKRTDFKTRFHGEYQKLLKGTHEDVWEDVRKKGIWLTGGFYYKKNQKTDSFELPRTVEAKHIENFLDAFIIVSKTKNEENLTESIINSLNHLFPENMPEFNDPKLVCGMLSDRIFNWMVAQNSKPLKMEDIHDLIFCLHSAIVESLSSVCVAEMKNTGLYFQQSILQDKPLYKMLLSWLSEPASRINSHLYNYHPVFVWQVLELLNPKPKNMFVDEKSFQLFKETILDVFHGSDFPQVLVVIPSEHSADLHNYLRAWSKFAPIPKRHKKIIILDQSTQADEHILIQDLTADSRNQMLAQSEDFRAFGTTIPLRELIRGEDGLSFLLGIKNCGNDAPIKRNINEANYEKIKSIYIQRLWIYCDNTNKGQRYEDPMSYLWYGKASLSDLYRNVLIENASINIVGFLEKIGIKHLSLDFLNKKENVRIPPPGEERNEQYTDNLKSSNELGSQMVEDLTGPNPTKVYILLNEAGTGKSCYLTWLAHDLQSTHPSWWVVKFNFIEYSTDFNRLPGSSEYKTMDSLVAIKLLYLFIHMSIYVPHINRGNITDSDVEREAAQAIADVLLLSGNLVELDENKLKSLNLTPERLVLLRLLQSKFNNQELVILLDGFDEIAPYYKEAALKMLSSFESFGGVRKLYVTSRPYDLRADLERGLQHYAFCRLKNLTSEKVLIYTLRFLSIRFDEYKTLSKNYQDFLLHFIRKILMSLLINMCEIPLFLAMGLELLLPVVKKHMHLEELSISPQMLKECDDTFELLRMMERFVHKKHGIANTEKSGSTDASAQTSLAKLDAAEKLKRINRIHSLLGLHVILNEQGMASLLSYDEQEEALNYMENVKNGSEKSGIVEGVEGKIPIFIHRLFAEYFAALWFVSNQRREGVKNFLKPLYEKEERKEVRQFIDRMVCRDSLLHMAVLDASEEAVTKTLECVPGRVNSTDSWGRTPLCLALLDRSHGNKRVVELLLDSVEETQINMKDNYFGWSALANAYSYDKAWGFASYTFPFVRQLLLHGASVDIEEMLARLEHENPVDMLLNAIIFEYGLFRVCKSQEENPQLKDKLEPLFTCVTNILISEKQLDLNTFICAEQFQHWLIFSDHTLEKQLKVLIENKAILTTLQLCAVTNSTFFQSLVENAGETQQILSNHAGHLLHLACNFYALNVVRYLVIDCTFSLSDTTNFKHVIVVLMVCMNNHKYMFKTLFQRYCMQYNIVCLEEEQLPPDTEQETMYDDVKLILINELLNSVPRQFEKTKLGLDSGTQFLLFRAIQSDNLAAVEHLVLKTDIKVNTHFILSLLKCHKLSWQCTNSYHYLLRKIENINETDESGENLLQIAIRESWFNLAKCLIDLYYLKTDNKEYNMNAFFYCMHAEHGNSQIFNYMIETHSMDCFDELDSLGHNMFYYAMQNNIAIAIHIFERECKMLEHLPIQDRILVLLRRLENGGLNSYWKIFFLAKCHLVDEASVKTICDYLQTTGDLSYKSDETGRNLLHSAVIEGWLIVVKCLIEHHGFKVKEQNVKENNWNAFFYCVNSGCDNQKLTEDIFSHMMEKDRMDCFDHSDSLGNSIFYYATDNNEEIAIQIFEQECTLVEQLPIQERILILLRRLENGRLTSYEKIQYLEKYRLVDEVSVKSICDYLETTGGLSYTDDETGQNLLHKCVDKGWLVLVKCLIENYGFDVQERNSKEYNWNAFFYCVNSSCNNHKFMRDIFSYMMETDPVDCFNQFDSLGNSIYLYATRNNRDIANLLYKLESSLLENCSVQERTLDLLRRLENEGFDTYGKIKYCKERRLIDKPSVEIICDYLQATGGMGFSDAETGRNLLHCAFAEGWPHVAECLIEHHGFNVKEKNVKENNWNAFFYCVNSKYNGYTLMSDIFSHMMEKAQVNCFEQLDSLGNSIFYYAMRNNRQIANQIFERECNSLEHLPIEKKLTRLLRRLEHGNLNNCDKLKYFEDCRLVDEVSVNIICDYLQKKDGLGSTDEATGRNLLHDAVREGWLEVVKCLIEQHGFSVKERNVKENNWNAFFYCVKSNCYNLELLGEIFAYMMETAQVDCFDRFDSLGNSVFYYATHNNEKIACQILNRSVS
uniref:NACHT domain-containing protein n=1 Tax=Anopheles atroparvus TaxID=41427 RepID=A0AAG5DM01_ANOAO